jgi:catechol-2,3-dioxygenase
MKRIHLHISVENLTQSIAFYNHLFGAKPTVEKADYAKWMLDNPLVNFAISQRGAKVGIDHIGIQVETEAELAELKNRIDEAQMSVVSQEGATCCYAKSDKHWVQDPSGIAWETYHTLDSSPTFNDSTPTKADSACCAPNSALSNAQTIQFGKRDISKASNCS